MNKILFVSAFYDINRNDWEKYGRSVDNYFKSFFILAKFIKYDLVVFIENKYLKLYANKLKSLKSKSSEGRLIIRNLDEIKNKLFLKKYQKIESSIINSKIYKSYLSEKTKNKPEHIYYQYNLINHDKVNFVNIAKNEFEGYKFYSWIDFGFAKDRDNNDIERIPKNLNFDYIPNDKILYQSLTKKITYVNAIQNLKSNDVHVQGTFWIVPNKLVEIYQEMYENELLNFHKKNIVDDDQNLVFQLIFKNPNKFILYYNKHFFSLYKNILNKPTISKLIN